MAAGSSHAAQTGVLPATSRRELSGSFATARIVVLFPSPMNLRLVACPFGYRAGTSCELLAANRSTTTDFQMQKLFRFGPIRQTPL